MYITYSIEIDQLKFVYECLFCSIKYKQIDMFLCGGMSHKAKKSYRDQIREKIESTTVNVLYPEDLFAEMLNRKKYDLLTLEAVLAQNSDVIVIFPESPGSYAELGAFANNQITAEKLVVFQHNRFKRAHSFITQGPINYMQRKYKGSVFFFNEDMDMTAYELQQVLRSKFRQNRTYPNVKFKDINQLTGLMTFSLLLLYLYENIAVSVLKRTIEKLYNELKHPISDYDIIYYASIKMMFKRGLIEKRNNNGEYYYCLTDKGFQKTSGLLDQIALPERAKRINKVRLDIIRDQLC